MKQLSLLENVVLNCYKDGQIDNDSLYQKVVNELHLDEDIRPIGKSNTLRSTLHRKIRWAQQNLKLTGDIKQASRGTWVLTKHKAIELHSIAASQHMVAASTSLGVTIWAKSQTVFSKILTNEPIHLALTSPPYPLQQPRAYGNHIDTLAYIDFICEVLEPIVAKLYKGGNIALNVGNDIFLKGMPARSTYIERLVIALEDRFGLYLMDRLIWSCPNKIPGPIAWASKQRMQLNAGFEPVLWFCNSPNDCIANNQRVLKPHTATHQKFIDTGGQQSRKVNSDGAYIKNIGAWSNKTAGSIPKNVLTFANTCQQSRDVSKQAKLMGVPSHGAKMPLKFADFLINFLSREGDLVVDPFGGTMTVGQGSENNNRRWLCVEMMWEYIAQSFVRFDDIYINPAFLSAIH